MIQHEIENDDKLKELQKKESEVVMVLLESPSGKINKEKTKKKKLKNKKKKPSNYFSNLMNFLKSVDIEKIFDFLINKLIGLAIIIFILTSIFD